MRNYLRPNPSPNIAVLRNLDLNQHVFCITRSFSGEIKKSLTNGIRSPESNYGDSFNVMIWDGSAVLSICTKPLETINYLLSVVSFMAFHLTAKRGPQNACLREPQRFSFYSLCTITKARFNTANALQSRIQISTSQTGTAELITQSIITLSHLTVIVQTRGNARQSSIIMCHQPTRATITQYEYSKHKTSLSEL